jgi:hypothetical protein
MVYGIYKITIAQRIAVVACCIEIHDFFGTCAFIERIYERINLKDAIPDRYTKR